MATSNEPANILEQNKYNDNTTPPIRITQPGSSRILYHVPCKVCRDHSSGKHYGIYACDGCAGFFKRSIRRSRQYVCKSQKNMICVMDKTHRNQCRSCRLQKCFEAGMNKDAVQHERGPRNSTLRRHMALYKDAIMGNNELSQIPHELLVNTAALTAYTGMAMPMPRPPLSHMRFPSPVVLDLSVPRAPHHPMHPNASNYFAPTAAYMNALVSRVLPPTPPLMATEQIKETAAEHLFKNINWIKNVKVFQELAMPDQLYLLEESWKEFFILAIAQYLMPINFSQLVFAYESENSNHDVVALVKREANSFQDVLNQLFHMNIDRNEYDFLRAFTLFRKPSSSSYDDMLNNSISTNNGSPNSSISGESHRLIQSSKVASLHENARNALISYVTQAHPNQPLRYQTLLGSLALISKISGFTIEELFFRKTIGEITIVKLISDMYCHKKF